MTIQESFKKNDLAALVSTKWFWMWIDKPNINFVIHYILSSSLEQYYQEIWRAGRNKEHSHSVILFNWPCEQCLRETNHFDSLEKLPQCLDSGDGVQWNKCPINKNPLCDIWRQLLMIKKPIFCKEENKFLDEFLTDYNWNNYQEIHKSENKLVSLQDFLLDKNNLKAWFTTVLTEFWQVFIFYKKYIYSSHEKVIQIPTQEDFCEQKLIYRLLCMWIIEKYFLDFKSNRFKVYLSGISSTELKNKVTDFLERKVEKISNNILTIEDEYIIKNASWSDINLKYFSEALYILIKKVYEKIETWRFNQFIHLYKSIQRATEQNKCFRWEILNRLLWITNVNDTSSCWFCSWCVKDAEHYHVTRWNLPHDKELKKVNSVLKKRLKWENLSKDEESFLKERTKKDIWMIRFRDKLDTLLSSLWDENSIVDVVNVFKEAKDNKLNISWNVERVLDTWNSWLNVLLLDSCLKVKDQFWLAKQNINKIISNHMNINSINIISSIVEQYWTDDVYNSVVDTFYDELSEQIPSVDDEKLLDKINGIRDLYLLKKLWDDNYLKVKNIIRLFH